MVRTWLAAAGALLLAACTTSDFATPAPEAEPRWVGAWASMQQIPEPHNVVDPAHLTDGTLRQIVRLSQGGPRLRVRVSNTFGTQPLHVGGASIARAVQPGTAAIVEGSGRALTFSGRPDVIIPAGAEYLSDPIDYPVAAFDDIAVSLHFPAAPAQQTSHPGSRMSSFFARGNAVADGDLPGAHVEQHWYQLSGIEVLGPSNAAALVLIGDSITDGRGSTTDGNNRWPDFLMRRLQANEATRHVSVLNMAAGGNRVLNDGLGPNVLARFGRDAIAQSGVKYIIVFEGVNDLGVQGREDASAAAFDALADRMIGAYGQIIDRAHGHDIRVYGATIAPYGGSSVYEASPAAVAAREKVNSWIRNSGRFDAVIDFDAAVRDPENPGRLLPAYDFGDGLHPNVAAFEAMANAIPLSLFSEAAPP